jgi:hypothetical protein
VTLRVRSTALYSSLKLNVLKPAAKRGLGLLGDEDEVGIEDELQRTLDHDRINAVVLLSDGRNHPRDDAGRAALLNAVDAVNQETSVRIFTVPYGADADTDLLGQIADVTKARFYDEAIDPTNIDEVMVSVFSNFG